MQDTRNIRHRWHIDFYCHLEFEVVKRRMLKEYHLDVLSWQDEERRIYSADVRSYFCAGGEFDFPSQIYAIRVFHGDYWFVKPQSASSIKFKVSTKFHGISPCHLSVKKWNTLLAYKVKLKVPPSNYEIDNLLQRVRADGNFCFVQNSIKLRKVNQPISRLVKQYRMRNLKYQRIVAFEMQLCMASGESVWTSFARTKLPKRIKGTLSFSTPYLNTHLF